MKYRAVIEKNDGTTELYVKQVSVPLYTLLKALEKGEILSFKISLD